MAELLRETATAGQERHANAATGVQVLLVFFQAEDGIRDLTVTGVQTCALPICAGRSYELLVREKRDPRESFSRVIRRVLSERPALTAGDLLAAMEAFQGKGAGARQIGRASGRGRR